MWSLLAAMVVTASPLPLPRLITDDGVAPGLEVTRWGGIVSPGERRVLRWATGPVLDVGCGPGRVSAHLARISVPTLGIDVAAAATSAARRKGAVAVTRCVFDPLPAEGLWGSAVLLDGNIGIGGDPRRLLCRLRTIVARRGRIITELSPPGVADRRFRLGLAGARQWQPWAVAGVDGATALAASASLRIVRMQQVESRWFAVFER